MSIASLDGLIWLIITAVPFLLVQRWVQRVVQRLFLLLTHSPTATIIIFSLLFLPGVLLHETSHYVMAKILRVPTGRFTIIPRMGPNNTLVMGSVEVAQVDFFRDTLIGAAPLISGGLLVAWLGSAKLGFAQLPPFLLSGNTELFFPALGSMFGQPDFWLWFYLAFAISSTMMPSPSDRGGFAACAGVIIGLILLAVLAGLGTWMLSYIAPRVNDGLRSLAAMFGISLVVNVLVGLPMAAIGELISRITGYRVG